MEAGPSLFSEAPLETLATSSLPQFPSEALKPTDVSDEPSKPLNPPLDVSNHRNPSPSEPGNSQPSKPPTDTSNDQNPNNAPMVGLELPSSKPPKLEDAAPDQAEPFPEPRKPSAIPRHLASVAAPPKTSKPLTALQELLAVVNSTVDDSPGLASEPDSQRPRKPLKPLDRLKQGVEQFRKLGPAGKPPGGKVFGGKQKRKGSKLSLPKKSHQKASPAPPPPKQPSPEVGPKSPLPKQETAAEMKKRVSQVTALLGREETPEEKRSHKKKIPLINIGERILIYWPMDGVFYGGKVIEHVVAKHRYTVLYEDNEVEVLDLSKEIWRPGTLDPKKDRLPGEGIPPIELGLPSEGEIPHYMPPRKRRRFEKIKKGAGRWGPKSSGLEAGGKKKMGFGKKGSKRMAGLGEAAAGGSAGGGLGVSDEGGASVQEMGAVEALLGVAGNKFGENVVGRREGSPVERGPIFIGLKKKRSKQGEGKLIRLAATLDRSSSGYFNNLVGASNGWSSSPVLSQLGPAPPPSTSTGQPSAVQLGASDASDTSPGKRSRKRSVRLDEINEGGRCGKRKGFRTLDGFNPSEDPQEQPLPPAQGPFSQRGTFAPAQAGAGQKLGVNAPNGAAPVPLPPDVQQILSDFEKQKLEKEAQKGQGVKGPGLKRVGGKRKRKGTFTPKSKPSALRTAKAQAVVRKRSFGETQFVELACGGALLMNAAGTSGGIPGGVEQKVVLGETGGAEMKLEAKENENAGEAGGAKTKPAVARTNSRLMRSAALVAQKRINATAGGTIAPAEVEAFRRGGVELPRKRMKREHALNAALPSSPIGPLAPTASPHAPASDAQNPSLDGVSPVSDNKPKPASRRLWWVDAFGGANFKSHQPPNDVTEEAWDMKPEVAIGEGVGETKVAGFVDGACSLLGDVNEVGAVPKSEGPGLREAVCTSTGLGTEAGVLEPPGGAKRLENGHGAWGADGLEQGGANTPGGVNGVNDSYSPKEEVVNTGDGVNGPTARGAPKSSTSRDICPEDGAIRASVTGVSETDGVNRVSVARGEKEMAAGVNGLGGMHGPETSRVESDSTAALQPHLENGSSGQASAAWQKLAAKTLAEAGGVAKWLEGLGLARLASLFAEHEVVDDALPHLTSDDLKEMGVKAVGTRRLILNNIELLKQGVIGDGQENVSQ